MKVYLSKYSEANPTRFAWVKSQLGNHSIITHSGGAYIDYDGLAKAGVLVCLVSSVHSLGMGQGKLVERALADGKEVFIISNEVNTFYKIKYVYNIDNYHKINYCQTHLLPGHDDLSKYLQVTYPEENSMNVRLLICHGHISK